MFLWIFSHSFFQKWILFGWNIPAFTLTVHWQPLNSDWTVCQMCIFFFFNSKYWVWNPDRPILIQWSLMCWLRGFRISRPQGSESWSGGKLKNIIASIHM
jgi:hypothetical protein